MDLKDCIYASINADYGRCKLGEFDVIMRKKDGWININKLCKDGKKIFSNWKRLAEAKETLKFYDKIVGGHNPSLMGGCQDDSYQCIEQVGKGDLVGNTNEVIQLLQGTYVPPKLAITVAQWVSVEFQYKVSCIVEEYTVSKYLTENKKLKEDVKVVTQHRDRLQEQLDEILRNTRSIIAQNTDLSTKLDETNAELSGANAKLGDVSAKLDVTNTKLGDANAKLDVTSKKLGDVSAKLDVTNTKLDKISLDLEEYHNATKNQKRFKEAIVVYRLAGDLAKKIIRIRAGQIAYLKQQLAGCDTDGVTYYENIANSKLALFMAKKYLNEKINGEECAFRVKDIKNRTMMRQFLRGVDKIYEEPSEVTPE